MRVVAEVPSMEMEATDGLKMDGTSPRRWKSVSFQELAQSVALPTCLAIPTQGCIYIGRQKLRKNTQNQ
jgi:hypothetical protein